MPTYRGHEVKVWYNPSKSNPSKPPYKAIQWSNGDYTCNCGGWLYPKNGNPRTCHHVRDAATEVRRNLGRERIKGSVFTKPSDPAGIKPPPNSPEEVVDFTPVMPKKVHPIHPEGRKFRLIRVAV